MWIQSKLIFILSLLVTVAVTPTNARSSQDNEDSSWGPIGCILGAVGIGVTTIIAAPLVLGAAGFTAAGIAAGSAGASMMSAAATTGIGAGAVAAAQAAGAAGLGIATKVVIGTVAGSAFYSANGCKKPKCDEDKDESTDNL